jgi:hypothetical protein
MQTSRFLLVATLAVIAAGCATTDPALPEPDMTPLGEVIENVHSQSELGRSSGYYATLARHWMSRQPPLST